MIDCTNEVYDKIAKVLRNKFKDIKLSSEYINKPSGFPYVSIVQSDNSIILNKTTCVTEMAQIMFEINVYSNKPNQRKIECEKIMQQIDNILFSMNFRRMAVTPVPNMEDATIYRIAARYRVATDGKNFYRR